MSDEAWLIYISMALTTVIILYLRRATQRLRSAQKLADAVKKFLYLTRRNSYQDENLINALKEYEEKQ